MPTPVNPVPLRQVLWLFALAWVSLATAQQQPPRFPNIGYLGLGYDLVNGNPAGGGSSVSDPGWAGNAIIELTYNTNKVTSDGRFSLPDQVDGRQDIGCTYSSQVVTIDEITDYQSSLKQDVSLSLGIKGILWQAAFSASATYQHVSEQISNYTSRFVSTSARCQLYEVSLTRYYPLPNVTRNFFTGVSTLPIEYDFQSYFDFIDYFGTHYASRVQMGAKAVLEFMFASEAYSSLLSGGVDIAAGASLSFAFIYGAADLDQNEHYQDYKAFSAAVDRTFSLGLGVSPPANPNQLKDPTGAAWVDAIMQSNAPLPMVYELTGIDTLLVPALFPDDPDIGVRQKNLQQAMLEYCGSVPGCAPPPPPPPCRTYFSPSVTYTQNGTTLQAYFSSCWLGPTECGQPSADFFCQAQKSGFKSAKSYQINTNGTSSYAGSGGDFEGQCFALFGTTCWFFSSVVCC